MKPFLTILALLCVAAAPVEAQRPQFGTYLRSPIGRTGHRFEFSDWLVFTGSGWRRSQVRDRHTGVGWVCSWYMGGWVRFSCEPPCRGDVGEML